MIDRLAVHPMDAAYRFIPPNHNFRQQMAAAVSFLLYIKYGKVPPSFQHIRRLAWDLSICIDRVRNMNYQPGQTPPRISFDFLPIYFSFHGPEFVSVRHGILLIPIYATTFYFFVHTDAGLGEISSRIFCVFSNIHIFR